MIKWEHSIFALPFASRRCCWRRTACLPGAPSPGFWSPWSPRAPAPWPSTAGPTPTWTPPIPAPAAAPFPPACSRASSCSASRCSWPLVFVLAAAQLNRLTLYLSPLVLVVLLGYSYMKRITRWSHLVLGLALGLAPSAAWIAVAAARPAHPGAHRGGHAVGGRLRRALRLPGLRARPRRRPPQPAPGRRHPAAFWAARAMHLAMLGLLVWFGCCSIFGVASAGWASPRWPAAGL
jgi:4-hydroxybenzoate polyprenyltransferase